MGKYNSHAGHCPQGHGANGAVGLLKESVEDRIVNDEVIRLLRANGHTVHDCTCNDYVSANECLKRIVAKCNQHSVDLDISIHLNSGRKDSTGDGSTGGVEVLIYDESTRDVAERICAKISGELGIRNRGARINKSLYVLKNTSSKAILIECCFVDDKDDADRWDAKKCAKAIVEGVLNMAVGSWQQDNKGWWYRNADGSYPKSQWKQIDGKWYYFDAEGYAICNQWKQIDGTWYYFQADCSTAVGWIQLNGTWYYTNSDGAMLTGLQVIGRQTYYFAADGHMCKTDENGALR